MSTASTRVFDGDGTAAINRHSNESTSELIIVETDYDGEALELQADALADVCDPGTQPIAIGHKNDTERYKQPIALTPHGAAFRANMAARIIDPRPPAARKPVSNAYGPVRAIRAYRFGEGKYPASASTTRSTSAEE